MIRECRGIDGSVPNYRRYDRFARATLSYVRPHIRVICIRARNHISWTSDGRAIENCAWIFIRGTVRQRDFFRRFPSSGKHTSIIWRLASHRYLDCILTFKPHLVNFFRVNFTLSYDFLTRSIANSWLKVVLEMTLTRRSFDF